MKSITLNNDMAPWKGWLRVAIPLVQCMILLATITVIALGAASSAVIERKWYLPYLEKIGQASLPQTSYTSTHELKVRIQLVCFYMLAPLAMIAFVIGEIMCLFTDDLAPLYVVIAPIFSALVWGMEIGFWTICDSYSGDAVPDMCPVIFKDGKGELFELSGLILPRIAVYVAALLVALYLTYAILGALVVHRERANEKHRKWIGDQKRASMARFSTDESSRRVSKESSAAQENTPMMETRASLAQERPRTVTWV